MPHILGDNLQDSWVLFFGELLETAYLPHDIAEAVCHLWHELVALLGAVVCQHDTQQGHQVGVVQLQPGIQLSRAIISLQKKIGIKILAQAKCHPSLATHNVLQL